MSEGKKSPWKRRIAIAAIGTFILILLAPTILVRSSIVTPLANRFAGISPLEISIDEVRGGWMQSVGIDGLKLVDAEGKTVASVASIQTEKSLVGFATNSSDLGTITIQGAEAVVSVADGTSNLEQALEPILAAEQEEIEDTTPAAPPTGRIIVTDSKLMVTEAGRPEQWVVELKNADVVLPAAGQLLGPTKVSAAVGDTSSSHGAVVGTIDLSVVSEDADKLVVDGTIENLPLAVYHIVAARVPGLPIDSVEGTLSTQLAGYYRNFEDFDIQAKGLNGQDLQIVAPELLGDSGVELSRLTVSGHAKAVSGKLSVSDAVLQCDFANAAASADLKWPLELPSLAQPLLADSQLDARGTIDLPRLIAAAPDLIPLRENLQLHAGTAGFVLRHDPTKIVSGIRLTGLDATAAGQKLTWQQPLAVDASVEQNGNALLLSTGLESDFGKLSARGDMQNGNLSGDFDLQRLYTEISRWIELPVTRMAGNVGVGGKWATNEAGVMDANVVINTTPMTIVTATGQIEEPAWQIDLNANMLFAGGSPSQVNSAAVSLVSQQEQLSVELKEPLSLSPESTQLAGFDASLSGDLANWMRRASVFMTEAMPAEVGGNANFKVSGRVGMSSAEVAAANWEAGPIRVKTQGLEFVEPRMIGSFRGNANTNDLMKLAVDELTVQSTAISLTAKDADQQGQRIGRAMYRVDLGRLMGNIAVDPNTTEAQTLVFGMLEGQFDWAINAQQANLQVGAAGKQIVVASRQAGQPDSTIWQEPNAKLSVNATYDMSSGEATVPQVIVETPWMNYTGKVNYIASAAADSGGQAALSGGSASPRTANQDKETPQSSTVVPAGFAGQPDAALAAQTAGASQPGGVLPSGTLEPGEAQQMTTVTSEGNLTYDAGLLSQKLAPLTGNQVALAGRHTSPVTAKLVMRDTDASVLSGLDAALNLGWDQANVVGIEIGQSNIPITVSAGTLTSAAELPVSGGQMRWNLTSDLAADELSIHLQPMNVLENVAITRQMCAGWLKYVAPLLADTTSVDGRLTLRLDEALLTPSRPMEQTIRGQLLVHDAQVGPGPFSTSILAIVSQINSLRNGGVGQSFSQSQTWLLLPQQQIDFRMQQGRVYHENVSVRVGDVNISTAGYVAVDGSMDLAASMPIPDDWIEKSPLLEGMRGSALTFPVGGTLAQPQINTDFLRQFSRQAVQGAARGLLQQGLSKGLDKLFGQPPGGGN